MNIIVCGSGKIGSTILKSLAAEGHNVVVLDNDPAVINEITNIYDVMGVCGSGTDCEALQEAGVDKTNLFVSATDSDELNMLSCFIARKMGARHTIARIRNPEYNDQKLSFLKKELHLSLAINPEYLAARELFNILKLPSAVKIETFSRRNFEMIELKLKDDSTFDGMPLIELRRKVSADFLVCTVQRKENVFIPGGDFVLQSGDKIGIVATPSDIQKLLKAMGVLQRQARNVMILGGSRTAYYLAKMLIAAGHSVKIIEKNRRRCDELCSKLPKAVIIYGDGAQQELLLEEGIDSTDAFVSLTGMDEENILISFFASSRNVPKVISKVNREELAAMAVKLGIDCIISQKEIVSDILLQYARALQNSLGSNVETLYKLMDGKAEALEFNVRSDLSFTEIPLKNLNFKPNILIAGIIRGRKTIVPSGDDMILAGDKVIVIAGNQRLSDLSDIIK